MRIQLSFKEYLDLELLDKGFPQRLVRVIANVIFKTKQGWTESRPSVIDTGSPVSVISKDVWEICEYRSFVETKVYGLIPRKDVYLSALYGEVICVFLDTRNVSPEFKCKTFLAKTTDVPIIIGFSELLDKIKIVIDYPNKIAYLEF